MIRHTRLGALLLALALFLTACGAPGGESVPTPGPGETLPTPGPEETAPAPTPEPTPESDPYDAVRSYWTEAQLTQAWGPNQTVEHLFFHPVIAYPQWAFHDCPSPQSQKEGLDDWMLTVEEYKKILNSLYEKGYILVAIEDVWSEVTDETGAHMVRNTLMLPEGKKPLVLSFDDVNYYDYMLEEGFTSRLVVGADGQIWAQCTDPYTQETFLTQDLDATTLLDQFVLEHPDFSLNGAKAIFSLTGYQGILGYRTQNDRDLPAGDPNRPAFDAFRQSEIEAVRPVIQRLRETGWTFGSHTWGHINLGSATRTLASVQTDTERWLEEVGSLVGPTQILFYPHGSRPDGDDVAQSGPMLQYLHSMGFRVFASVGVESYSKIKSDLSAVICDRLHPDGTTLRWQRDRYLRFYDAADILDLAVRPDLGKSW
ncbi:hydrolase [uncultured Intestinimonas sp.]|uniref:polysaccharide deacetylase family protein n=1 Tax=uncultured Intestinimonas sp. TaxID=1689265 RepID=UPI0025CC7432|nr:hydrolase [uncultured Intestinimonas sp.]